MEQLRRISAFILSSSPRPGLTPMPGTVPLTFEAALCPPLLYYVALLFLPPVDGRPVAILRSVLALLSGFLFFRLPLVYYVPQSIGLTYQLALVGLYGGCRVCDAFFISPYLFDHIPRRVQYRHVPRIESRGPAEREDGDCSSSSSSSSSKFFQQVDANLLRTKSDPVTETATTEDGWPHSWADRASWAFELELSMRGVGFTWSTADVRHTKQTWRPSVHNRLHSILVHCVPILGISWMVIRRVYTGHLHHHADVGDTTAAFDALPLRLQLELTAALGAFLMTAFSLGHSLFAIALAPLDPHPLSFFPPLYTSRIWSIESVRGFWSYGWHRLFARLFLVYGVWPGEWVERKLLGKRKEEPADVGKVLGGFISSAFVHAFAVRTVVGGKWVDALGEAKFFAVNGIAVVVEGGVRQYVLTRRRRRKDPILDKWYDGIVGRVWWVIIVLYSGRNFARGWVKAGLVREMAGL